MEKKIPYIYRWKRKSIVQTNKNTKRERKIFLRREICKWSMAKRTKRCKKSFIQFTFYNKSSRKSTKNLFCGRGKRCRNSKRKRNCGNYYRWSALMGNCHKTLQTLWKVLIYVLYQIMTKWGRSLQWKLQIS